MNQKQKSALTKIFSLSGTILLAAPIIFMLLTAIIGSIASKQLLFDYLALEEMYPLIALGLVLLILASLLSHELSKWFIWGSAAAFAAFVSGQIFAVVSGLASGAVSRDSGAFAVVLVSVIVFNLLIAALCALGFVLLKRLYCKKAEAPSSNAQY